MMKKAERETSEGIKLLNYETGRRLGETENYKHLWTLEVDNIKEAELERKKKKKKERKGKNEKLREKKWCSKNLIKGIKQRGSPPNVYMNLS